MTAAAPVDRDAAALLWADYAGAHPGRVSACADYTVERFGDSAELADELLALVVCGVKRATAALVAEFAEAGESLPRVGSHWVACDGGGVPRLVLRSTELRIGPFGSADAAFALDEGEDDRTLESWLQGHRRYWERTRAAAGDRFEGTEEVVFERFAVVWPPEHAD